MPNVETFKARVESALQSRRELTTLVSVLRRVQQVLANPQSSSAELARIISSDPVLTTKVLRLTNSARFNLRRRIGSVEEATVMLGYVQLSHLCSALLGTSIMGYESRYKDFDRAALWRHALGTAVAAKQIQEELSVNIATDISSCGLLCNIGRIIMDQWFPEEFARVWTVAKEKHVHLIDAEYEVLGVSHADIGFWAAEAWHFDGTVAHVIRTHHGPGELKASDIVNLAYVITHAQRIGSPGDSVLNHLLPGSFERLGLNPERLDQLLRRLNRAYSSLTPILESMSGDGKHHHSEGPDADAQERRST